MEIARENRMGTIVLSVRPGLLMLRLPARSMESSRSEVTALLQLWSDGRREALDRLLPQIYAELRRLASSYLRRERPDHTLQPTALVHEAFIKLIDQRAVRWQNRAHFFGIAAQAMRRILVDHARAHAAGKRSS
jgi:RNA polymerase sigma factor (TIGR02999 family)